MNYTNPTILSGVDTASLNGSAIDSSQLFEASFQSVFQDVTAVGTIQIQGSNDAYNSFYIQGQFVPTNWSNCPGTSSAAVVAGVAPMIQLQLSYRWIRAIYTRTSGGSSTFVVNMYAQSV